MSQLSEFEKQREANIAKNRALLAQLELKEAAAGLAFPATNPQTQKGAKPVQSSQTRKRRAAEPPAPRRQSSRLNKPVIDPNESPEQKRKREMEEEARRIQEEDERLEREERERAAKRPRHQNLDLSSLGDELSAQELISLTTTLEGCARAGQRENEARVFDFSASKKEEYQVTELKTQFANMKIVSRAKVTNERVYSSLYHPEKTKDLVFFGDKHGQLGIWDALAPQEEVEDENGDVMISDEGGKIFRLQPHWPATSKSSISCIKLDPLNTRNVFTSAYDCTLRSISFESGISRELFALDDVLISSFDVPPSGKELWISDAEGGLTHTDMRERKSRACRYQLANTKIGCVSVNPAHPEGLLVSSNNRTLTMWDARMLSKLPIDSLPTPPPSSPMGPRGRVASGPMDINSDAITDFLESKRGKGALMADWPHQKSVSSAYWDPSGTRIVSTCYDDTIRLWNVRWSAMTADKQVKVFEPFSRRHHNCQTGKWVTILKSQWNQNPEVYPHFTVGNMNHSLNVIAATGEVVASLTDRTRVTAVQAVTSSHPGIVARIASGNASGRCALWAPADSEA
ncbi:WD40-repeat-containing domain protein [Gautieria morchelliformis]|nr:WD40-repeat-containing domain protein [Gautieria morchelliformis]